MLKKIKDFASDCILFGEIPLVTSIIVHSAGRLPELYRNKLMTLKHKLIIRHIRGRLNTPNPSFREPTIYKNQNVQEEPIWFFWGQGMENMPAVVSLCLKYLQKNSSNHIVYFLDMNNVTDYVNIPQFIIQATKCNKFGYSHFADLLRISLLNTYGGLWCDATCLILKEIPNEIFKMPFYSIKNNIHSTSNRYVSQYRWSGFFMCAERNNMLIQRILYDFLYYLYQNIKVVDYLILDYLIENACLSNEKIKNMLDAIPYNNPNCHNLLPVLVSEYPPTKWEKIIAENFVFKLNWREYTEEELYKNTNNVFNHLKKQLK